MNEENKNQITLLDNLKDEIDIIFNLVILGEKGKK